MESMEQEMTASWVGALGLVIGYKIEKMAWRMKLENRRIRR
jgi:hypothetical protein